MHTEPQKGFFKRMLKKLNQPVFILFLAAAFSLWYLNKLNDIYASTVVIPVTIVDSYANGKMLDDPDLDIVCRVNGKGYNLLVSRFMPSRNHVEIPVDEIDLIPNDSIKFRYSVTTSSMQKVLESKLDKVKVMAVLTADIQISLSSLSSKRVKIIPVLDIRCKDQYMVIDQGFVTPSEVSVKASRTVLDTLKYIYTEPRKITDLSSSIQIDLSLADVEGIVTPKDKIKYKIDIARFTEESYRLPISVISLPDTIAPIIIPDSVTVLCNVIEKNYADINSSMFNAVIDYADKEKNLSDKFKVYVTSEQKSIKIKDVSPQYVDLFLEVKK